MIELNAKDSQCLVRTWREGLAAAVGHDLVLDCARFEVKIDPERKSVVARFYPDSLCVLGTHEEYERGGADPKTSALSGRDQKKIVQNIRRDILKTDEYPLILFESTSITREAEQLRVQGELELVGKRNKIEFVVIRDGEQARARVELNQPDFGIAPFRAMMGALKIKAKLEVEFCGPWVF